MVVNLHDRVCVRLQLLLAGLQDIDVNDWKRHTKYRGEYNANHPVIINFWKVGLLVSGLFRVESHTLGLF